MAIVVLFGGGVKSAVAAARYAKDNELILAHVDYGQRSAKMEVEAARDMARSLSKARALTLDAKFVQQLEHPFATPKNAEAGPTDQTDQASAALLVAYRGLVPSLLTIGLQTALRLGATQVVTGLSRLCRAEHLGLSATDGRPDQLRELVYALGYVADAVEPARSPVRIEAPLVDLSYAEIVKLAHRFQVRLELTWTCEGKSKRPCGACDRCIERSHAFDEARLVDPQATAVPA